MGLMSYEAGYPMQAFPGPLILPGFPGRRLKTTAMGDEAAPFPQEFVPATITLPFTGPAPTLTVMDEVLPPAVIIIPVGKVHW